MAGLYESSNEPAGSLKAICKQEIESVKTNIGGHSEKIELLRQEIEPMKRKIKQYEINQRKRTLLFFGVDEKGREFAIETGEAIRRVCYEIFKLEVRAEDIGLGYKRPIVIRFSNIVTKEKISRNLHRVRGTGMRVGNDLNYEIRCKRKLLLPFLKVARVNGHFAKLHEDKLKINGKFYDAEFCKTNEDHPIFGLSTKKREHQYAKEQRRSEDTRAQGTNGQTDGITIVRKKNGQEKNKMKQPQLSHKVKMGKLKKIIGMD
ncbi:hypothetical protein ANN_09822 [Periplaneta americana]|uniref:Endonuclease-reverse transcriptase n=1 Tax=Periplaneta americana TaxID=6978 RepID=A0ABQ8TQC9_PERAM|nr:hypothetical protein ANN_09822 [Periplaneta americana]